MSIGYYIVLGDKTDCVGQVLEGSYGISWDGSIHALEGHKVSCGKDGKAYPIMGRLSSFTSDGRRVAGTLDSFSGCPCRARLLPSVFSASYQGEAIPALARANVAPPPPPSQRANGASSAYSLDAYDERFQLLDDRGSALCSADYVLLEGTQCIGFGALDDRGCSVSQCSLTPSQLNLATRAPSPFLE